ncbi:5-oxoprolinase subunit PxpB [Virgibacillus sp. DJP39]|uniref:5-oxoprolinase subunit PxpB n=1 Tax=Virgibacillus sp. DJP39 TaxID=3409790 RepID=UPI003BB4DA75
MNISIQPLGDSGVKVLFHEKVTPELNSAIQEFCQKLSTHPINGVIEWVPAFDSVGIYYNLHSISYDEISNLIKKLHIKRIKSTVNTKRLVHIPVVYGGEYGPDLERVAKHSDCTTDEVVELHQEGSYLVYMLGFLPGFPYLGGMTSRIATPRLKEPRAKITAGSVGIADTQTGIYPVQSPGGWNIIGRSPINLFDTNSSNPIVFRAGDYVKFYAISTDEFTNTKDKVENGIYELQSEIWNGGGTIE